MGVAASLAGLQMLWQTGCMEIALAGLAWGLDLSHSQEVELLQ
jgi:hypothetical protein